MSEYDKFSMICNNIIKSIINSIMSNDKIFHGNVSIFKK